MKTQYERADIVPLLAEVFRELGYEGTSLNSITKRTGVGKGSLYHFFPGGKEEMAAAVIESIDRWFEDEIFKPLRGVSSDDPLSMMWQNVISYFRSGGRVCLLGAFALDVTRDRFAAVIEDYFRRWIASLAVALIGKGASQDDANRCAEHIVLTIQGAIVLSRALKEPDVFNRAIDSGQKLAATLAAER